MDAVMNFVQQTGFYQIFANGALDSLVMILIACILLYLAIVKKYEKEAMNLINNYE